MSFEAKRDLMTHYICLLLAKASEGPALPLGGWHEQDNGLIMKFAMKNAQSSAELAGMRLKPVLALVYLGSSCADFSVAL